MPLYARAIADTDELIDDVVDNTPDEQLTAEDRTYKKRYGDLRRFQQSEAAKFRADIDALKAQLNSSTRSNLNLPNSTNDDEIDKWMKDYPQVAAIVAGIASRQANAANTQLQTSVEELNTRRQQMDEEYAQKQIAQLHPDFFDEIRLDEKFHEWLADQSQMIQDALYVNSTDWKTASNVIQMYKVQNGIGAKKEEKKDTRKDAARPVGSRQSAAPKDTGSSEVLFRESQIAQMSAQEYDAREEEIDTAWRQGKVLRDLTGGAR